MKFHGIDVREEMIDPVWNPYILFSISTFFTTYVIFHFVNLLKLLQENIGTSR